MTRSGRTRSIATLPQVAAAAGVATATAARALGGYGSVSAATRSKVLAAADELGYHANSLARSMIRGRTNTLGVVLADIENTFFSRALRGITDVARAAGYEVVLVNTDEDTEVERLALGVLTENRVDGLILSPGDGTDAAALAAALAGTPTVLLDRRIRGLAADTVGIDNRAAAREATRQLLRLGHTRIAMLTGAAEPFRAALTPPGLRGVERLAIGTAGSRTAGYRDALVEAGVPPRPEYVSVEGFRREDAARATRRLLALPDPPTAILAQDSLLSLGVLEALAAASVRCPQDVSVLGFDDADWAEAVSPALSVIAQPVHDLGAEACRLLLRRLEGAAGRAVHRTFPTRFIDRASLGPPPARRRRYLSERSQPV